MAKLKYITIEEERAIKLYQYMLQMAETAIDFGMSKTDKRLEPVYDMINYLANRLHIPEVKPKDKD